MTLLLSDPNGGELLPGMSRLLRTIGVPVLNMLETRLYDSRRQRVSAAIKVTWGDGRGSIAAGIDASAGELGVEFAGPGGERTGAAREFGVGAERCFCVFRDAGEAHPLVVPMMIDQIGLAQETTCVPQLMEIAAGEHDTLRDQFVRIKAIEALGRMRAHESAELLRTLAEKRDGIAYAEPSGLRAARKTHWR